jgi:S1-C subfamily serine protease
MDRASIRWASTLVAMASAVPLVGCMRHAVKSAFEDDFRCPVASDVSDMGNDRYRVSGCGREAVYQCLQNIQGHPICALQLTEDVEAEASEPLPMTPVVSQAKLAKNDAGESTVSLDVRLDTYSLVTLRAEPSRVPDIVQFRLLHRPENAELQTCDLGLMIDGQVVSTPKLSVSKQRSSLILGLKLSREFMRDLGAARKVSLRACNQRWSLEAEQIAQLHRFVDLYEDEVAWKVSGRDGGSGGRTPPRGGWPNWKPDAPAPAALSGDALDPRLLFQRLSPSVLKVEAYVMQGVRQGSAVAVTTTEALTNCHIVEGALKVVVSHDKRELVAELKRADPATDRCVLTVAEPALVPIGGVRPYASLEVGEPLFTLGSPSGLELTLSNGILSGRREVQGRKFVQTTAPVSPGSSGGGLFDGRGNLVGITTLVLGGRENENQALNFAIPADSFFQVPGAALSERQ